MTLSKAKRSAAAKKAARTRKRRAAAKKAGKTKRMKKIQENRKKGAAKTIAKIKKSGSKENFDLKLDVGKKLSRVRHGELKCQCCGDSFKPHFIDIDHKYGRKEISKIKSLQKIDYKEKRSGKTLSRWLLKHIDKKIISQHFQILCHNCNRAKFLYKTCPHQRK
tara:strand:+ start:943 stop:1434 length:492 start_codon:yes stop_codon:yes gene_type:complete